MDKLIELLREVFAGLWSHAELAGPLLRDQYEIQEWAYAGGTSVIAAMFFVTTVILTRLTVKEEDHETAIVWVAFVIVTMTATFVTSSVALDHIVHALTPELSMLKEAM